MSAKWRCRRSMDDGSHVERAYRGIMEPAGLTCYEVAAGESDLYVCTRGDRSADAAESLARHRNELEEYLRRHVDFGISFKPVPVDRGAPGIVKAMAGAAQRFDVGPMASVAGAVAQFVGSDLLRVSREVIVENGGDLFLAGGGKRRVRVFSGTEFPQVDIIVRDSPDGIGVCTSSATVGPSLSMGAADAVTVLSPDAATADAAATAIGNSVLRPGDIEAGLRLAERLEGVEGALIVIEGSMGAWGNLEIA